jgi:hypothetical protein
LNTNEDKFEDMTNEVQVDEGVIAKKKNACCNQQNIAIEFKKGMQSTRTQIMIEHGENYKSKFEEKSTKLKVQRKAKKDFEIMS